jgi:hypothetical protein
MASKRTKKRWIEPAWIAQIEKAKDEAMGNGWGVGWATDIVEASRPYSLRCQIGDVVDVDGEPLTCLHVVQGLTLRLMGTSYPSRHVVYWLGLAGVTMEHVKDCQERALALV